MLRVFLTIVLPLVLPTALYLSVGAACRAGPEAARRGRAGRRCRGSGWRAPARLLLALVLFVVTVGFGTSQPGVYVPPRWENGRIVPGHIEPEHSP